MDINMSRFMLHVLAVLIITICDVRRGVCQTLTGPSDTHVVQGEDGTLICSVTGYTASPFFVWTDKSVTPILLIYNGGAKFSQAPKYDNFVLNEPGDDTSTLTITSAAVEDEGTYICAYQGGQSGDATVTVDVQGTLSDVSGLPSNLIFNQDYTAQCIVTGSRPQVATEWYINDKQQTTGIIETPAVNPSNSNLSDTTSDFTFTATIGLNAASLKCRVSGYRAASLQIPAQESNTSLNVNYPPSYVTLSFNADGTQVSCEVDDANPSVTYYIYKNDSLIYQGTTGFTTIFPPNAADKFICVAENYLANVTDDGYYIPLPTSQALPITTAWSPTTVPVPTTGDGLSSAATAVIAILVIILVTSLTANVFLVILLRREKSKSNDAKKARSEVNTDADDGKPYEMLAPGTKTNATYTALSLRFTGDGSMSIPAGDVSFFTRLGPIGSGEFGDVWKGELHSSQRGTSVVIRQMRGNECDSSTVTHVVRTLSTLTGHPNIVKCIGYYPEQRGILYEFVSGGSLLTHLQKNGAHGQRTYGNMKGSKSRLDEASLLKFACQVANGMDFLSSRKITHGALCAHNVLMTEKKKCKISDYGLVSMTTGQKPKPTRWSSPETLLNGACSVESDVWSFGIVLWEIVTLGAKPYPGMNFITVKKEVTNGYKMPRPRHCGQPLYNIMIECWENAPTRRSKFNQTLRKLEQLLEQTQGYISIDDLDTELYHEYYEPVE